MEEKRSINILDIASRAACWAHVERKVSKGKEERIMSKRQVEMLLEVLENTKNVNYVILFIAKQRRKGEIGRNTAKVLVDMLRIIGDDVDKAREALGLFKWLYEATDERTKLPRCNKISFSDYIESVLT